MAERLQALQEQIKSRAILITLEEAVLLSIRNNPQLAGAFSKIQQFEWQLIAAQRQWYPTAQLANGAPFVGQQWQTFVQKNYAASSAQLGELGLPREEVFATSQAVFQPGLYLNWNFIDPTRQPNINAASESLRQQKLLFDVSARNLILDVQQNYFEIQSNQQLIDNFSQILEINKRQLTILEEKRGIGIATVLDVEQQRAQLYIELSDLILYTLDYIKRSAQLAENLGLEPNALAVPSERANTQGEWMMDLQDTLRQAINNREEILASLAAAEAAQWSSIAALRTYLPVFSLTANGSLIGTNGLDNVDISANTADRYSSSRYWSGSAGIGFTWSLFDGGIQAANSESARANEREFRAQAIATELQVTQQVRSSYAQMETSRIGIVSAEQAYASAGLALDAARARFEVGVGDMTSVVQTIQQLASAARQVSTATLAYNSAVAELYRYSATWPNGSEQELIKRLQDLRKPTQEQMELVTR